MFKIVKPPIHPYIPITVGVISVTLSFLFVKMATADAGVIAFYRMLFSVLIMLPIFLFYYKEIFLLSKKDWILSVAGGILLAYHFVFWFESLNYTSVASSTVLVTLQPIFAIAGTYFFFKERLSLKTIISAAIAIIGSIIISWGDFRLSGTAFFGDLLVLIGCVLITAYLLLGQDVRERLSLITYTFIVYSISTITLFFYVIFKGETFGPYPSSDWFWFLMLALIPNLLGHTLFNWSLKWVSTNVISIAILFEPVGASILAYFIFFEELTLTQVVGGIVVILGIILFVIDLRKLKDKLVLKKT